MTPETYRRNPARDVEQLASATVKPWVADLHYGVITAMFFAFIAGFCIFILIRMAKIVPENSNPQT